MAHCIFNPAPPLLPQTPFLVCKSLTLLVPVRLGFSMQFELSGQSSCSMDEAICTRNDKKCVLARKMPVGAQIKISPASAVSHPFCITSAHLASAHVDQTQGTAT